jgi:RND family efflux transporter MFP subunit
MQIDPRKQMASTVSVTESAESARASVASAQAGTASAQADLANAKAQLKNYQADRISKQADLKFNRTQYQRYTKLYQDGAVSKQELDQYTNSLEAAQASLEAVDAQIEAQRAEIASKLANITSKQAEVARYQRSYQQALANTQEQQVELQYYKISAPFTGTIGDIPVKEGDFVDTATSLVTLTQNNALEVNVAIPIEKASQVGIGTQVELVNASGAQVGTSRVFFISPNVANDTQSVLIKAKVENNSGQLRADQQIRARVVWERQPSVLIPVTAISRVAGQNFVYVAEAGKSGLVAKQKPIKLGVVQGNNQQVIEGLRSGEKIVTSGLQKLADGAPIVPET